MILNYIKVALRNIIRSRSSSAINITGLAVGMSVTLLIGMWVFDEVSFNRSHEKYESIGSIHHHKIEGDGKIETLTTGPLPIGPELKANYPGVFKNVARVWWESNHTMAIGDHKVSHYGTFSEPAIIDMLSLEMIRGTNTALNDPSSIILSEKTATALFGETDPIDKLIRIDNMADVKVSGIFKNIPDNSSFHEVAFIGSWDHWSSFNPWMKKDENNWKLELKTLVELQPGVSFEQASAAIEDLKSAHLTIDEATQEQPQLFVHPMASWHLYSEWDNGQPVRGRIQFVWLFGIIGAFVLLLACINFMNLSTARSEKRAREVGIRKSIGSARSQLVGQFLTESVLVVLFSWIVSLAIAGIMLPLFNSLAGKQMELPFTQPLFWIGSVGFILITGLISGSYPALFLSSFQPVKVLKGTFKAGRFASVPRKVLVVLQFTVSITLIIGTIVVWQQVQFAKNRPIGYTREGLIQVRKTSPEFWVYGESLRQQLLTSGGASDIAESANPPTIIWFENTGFNWKGKNPNMQDNFVTMGVSLDYGRTVGWDFLQGRDFSRDHSTDSSAIVINEAAAAYMGLDNPVNEEVTWNGRKYTVVGVIKDMIMTSPFEPVKQTIFHLANDIVIINVRLNPELSTSEAMSRIENVFKTLMPTVPFDYTFTDEEYALKFAAEERIGQLASVFAVLAIFISCLGLFGMASFVAEQRRKEVGIRKILGASVPTLWKMLSLEFVALVTIACAIAVPISWGYLSQWLDKYEYRTDLSLWIFAAACTGALLITLLTVSYQTIRAAIVNPIHSLKAE